MDSYQPITDKTQNELLQQRTKELQTLVRVAQLINVIDLDYVLAQTLQLTTEVSNASKGSFFLLNDAQQPIQRFITQRNMPPEVSREVARHVVEKGLAGWVIRHRRGAIVEDVLRDDRWHIFPDDSQDDVRSALCMPVTYESELQGILTLVAPEVGHFDESDLQLVSAVVNQVSTAIRNAQLFDYLRMKQRQLKLVLQNASEALLTVSPNFVITLINPKALYLLREPSEEDLLGRRLDDIDPDSIYPEIVRRITSASPSANALSFEIRDEIQKRDFLINIAVLRREREGIVQGYVISIQDVTSLKDFDRLKTHMLQMFTHDLKNPLNIALGYADMLKSDSEQGLPTESAFISEILNQLQRIEQLIQETLSVFRLMSTGQMQSRFPPEELINDALSNLRPLAEQKAQIIYEDIQPNMPELMGSDFQIREAMSNLISNAIKYTPEGGHITIHASTDDEKFNFYVKDTGLGVPMELQGELFSQFYRANRPETEKIEGTGLGLSLVKGAIERHQGRVWFESAEGKGSTFGFWLPLPEDNAE